MFSALFGGSDKSANPAYILVEKVGAPRPFVSGICSERGQRRIVTSLIELRRSRVRRRVRRRVCFAPRVHVK